MFWTPIREWGRFARVRWLRPGLGDCTASLRHELVFGGFGLGLRQAHDLGGHLVSVWQEEDVEGHVIGLWQKQDMGGAGAGLWRPTCRPAYSKL